MARVDLIDLHCHILPGIDDGPETLAESVAMARAASAAGIRTLVATPHLREDFPAVRVDEIQHRCDEVRAAIAAEDVELELVAGGEVGLAWALEASDDALALASYDQRGTDLLIETPAVGGPLLSRLIAQVAARGYRIVLAHPERSVEFQREPRRLAELANQGVLLQVNADAVIANPRRSRSAKLAGRLFKSGLVSVIASDGHRAAEWRPVTRLADAAARIRGSANPCLADALMHDMPRAILSGAGLPPVPGRRPTISESLRRAPAG